MRTLRRAGALIAAGLTAAALLAPTANAQSSSLGSSGSSWVSNSPVDWATAISEGLNVTMIGNVIGQAQTGNFNLVGGDLGVMASIGTGEEFAIVFGDSFTAPRLSGAWMSPVGVVAQMGTDGTIHVTRPLNDGAEVKQLIGYDHAGRLTLLPSDIINVGGTLYMQGMWNRGIGNVFYTEIFSSTDNGMTWTSEGKTPPNFMNGMGNLITWEQGPDGYIYVMSSQFKRSGPVYLSRFLIADIGDRSQWNTGNNSVYTTTQFNVKGLDTFFGINTAGPDPAPTTNQTDVDVTVTGTETIVP